MSLREKFLIRVIAHPHKAEECTIDYFESDIKTYFCDEIKSSAFISHLNETIKAWQVQFPLTEQSSTDLQPCVSLDSSFDLHSSASVESSLDLQVSHSAIDLQPSQSSRFLRPLLHARTPSATDSFTAAAMSSHRRMLPRATSCVTLQPLGDNPTSHGSTTSDIVRSVTDSFQTVAMSSYRRMLPRTTSCLTLQPLDENSTSRRSSCHQDLSKTTTSDVIPLPSLGDCDPMPTAMIRRRVSISPHPTTIQPLRQSSHSINSRTFHLDKDISGQSLRPTTGRAPTPYKG